MPAPSDLPIWEIHQEILQSLEDGNRLVLIAPTGSGKSTQVPQMLADAAPADDQRIVILQPRRVAARSLAARVAWERQSPLGQVVGYQIRFDDQVSAQTRIVYVTEGILIRWLQDNPELKGIGAILFDEFHERNLLSDVALALVKTLQTQKRPDLKVVVMSATLDAQPVAQYLDDCPVLEAQGRSFPVQVHYAEYLNRGPMPEQAREAVEKILRMGEPGDILIFMPGMGEINATLQSLKSIRTQESLSLLPLHGDLSPEIQDQAFAGSDRRKVVVATNVAETSVTIEGIRFVIDSGQARIARYDPEKGMGTLFVEEISRASADQRTGRAGRTAPGQCYRLWTESGHLNRPERHTPEIQRTDLAEVVLLLHALHIRRAAQFDWLDKPDPAAVDQAEKLLHTLGALDPRTEGLTATGQFMRRLPMHPRFSRILVEAVRHGKECTVAAALCTALVSGRDLLVRLGRDERQVTQAREAFDDEWESDFLVLINAYQCARDHRYDVEACRGYGIHAQTARLVAQTHQQVLALIEKQRLPIEDRPFDKERLLQSIMTGFIDQLCQRRDQGTLECRVAGGRSGTLMRESVVQTEPLFVACTMREISTKGRGSMNLLGLASVVRENWVQALFPEQIITRTAYEYDRHHKRVAGFKQRCIQDLILGQETLKELDPLESGLCLARACVEKQFELPLFNHETRQLIARANLVAALFPELDFPGFDEAAIVACLGRALRGCTLTKEAQKKPIKPAFQAFINPDQMEWLNELAPVTLKWPDGKSRKLNYPDPPLDKSGVPLPPELQVKLHECFPLTEHPKVCEGKLAVKLMLGAPNGKRLDSTVDWLNFKRTGYPRHKAMLLKKFPGVGWI